MSMARELIAAVIAAERNIDEQIMRLHSFARKNDDIMQEISRELEGSVHASSRNMKQQLSQIQVEIKATIASLETAKIKLNRVRQI